MSILFYHFNRIYDCRKNFVRLDRFYFFNVYKKNEKIIQKYFKDKYGK